MPHTPKYVLALKDGRSEPIRDLDNASRIILIDREQTAAEDITFGFSRFEAHTALHKKHAHSEAEEIMYILSGRGRGGVNGEEFDLKAGDTLWVPRGAEHWFSNPYDAPCEFLFIYTRASLKEAGYQVTG
jgi:mannose-6-phosphate isomerase-like protein (cupin superfamily)